MNEDQLMDGKDLFLQFISNLEEQARHELSDDADCRKLLAYIRDELGFSVYVYDNS